MRFLLDKICGLVIIRLSPYLASLISYIAYISLICPGDVRISGPELILSPLRRRMMKWSWSLAAVLCCFSLFAFAKPNEPGSNSPHKESSAAESILADYAKEVEHARTWLEHHND